MKRTEGRKRRGKAETGGIIYGSLKSPTVSWSTEYLKESAMPILRLPLSMGQTMDVEEISSGLHTRFPQPAKGMIGVFVVLCTVFHAPSVVVRKPFLANSWRYIPR